MHRVVGRLIAQSLPLVALAVASTTGRALLRNAAAAGNSPVLPTSFVPVESFYSPPITYVGSSPGMIVSVTQINVQLGCPKVTETTVEGYYNRFNLQVGQYRTRSFYIWMDLNIPYSVCH